MSSRRLWEFLAGFGSRFREDDVFTLAAAIAFSALLSLFPLLIGLIAFLSRFVEQAEAQRAIVDALRPYLPPGVVSLVWGTLDAAIRARGTAGVAAVVGLFWAATAAASMVRHSLNRIFGVRRARPFWRRKLVELFLVGLVGGLISLSITSSLLAAAAERIPGLGAVAEALRSSAGYRRLLALGPWLFSAAAFVILYRFLPNVRMRWSSLLIGSLMSVILFESVKRAFFWYLRALADYPLVYSHLAGVVVFMVWAYLVALVVLLGAEVIVLVEPGLRPPPGDHDRSARLAGGAIGG